ncbi:Odorant receptor 94b [Culex quinquefasciatus]|uniref:Odorant receptor n=1 Tax=Culex quinquefasciatus TaxID=7176 RepID=B0W598_CULQU|nr:Odorant receptor 94b [Culex quinquefasciatus]|eukprot:XP_001843882.1 Odorant receptor 94b [Culex quinquefasciatus]
MHFYVSLKLKRAVTTDGCKVDRVIYVRMYVQMQYYGARGEFPKIFRTQQTTSAAAVDSFEILLTSEGADIPARVWAPPGLLVGLRIQPQKLDACRRKLNPFGLVKAYIYSHDTIYDLLQYNMKRFENPKKIPEIHTSLMKTASWCTISVKLIAPAYFTLAAFTVIFSVVISAFNRRFELPFGFFIPGVDRTTWVGYLLNLAFHTLQAFEAGAGLLATDLCFFNLMINAIGQLDVLIIGLKKLGEAATSDELAETELLNDIIEKHVEHVKYLSAMESHMKAGYFINNVCLITELVTCLHVVLTNDEIWFTGISLAICYSFQLVIPCFMGTFLSSKNDELIREIYNIPWNELPIPAQHSLQLLLHAAQTPVTLSDGFAPIDLDSFLEIYKKIYSYLAMIQNIN